MKIMKIKVTHFLSMALLFCALTLTQNNAIAQSGSGQVSLKKQKAISKLFDGAKIINAESWKAHVMAHPSLKKQAKKLNIINGAVYSIKKQGEESITVLFTKTNLYFIKGKPHLKTYTGKYVPESLFKNILKPMFFPYVIGHHCMANGNCVEVYHAFDTSCSACGGTEINGVSPSHKILAKR